MSYDRAVEAAVDALFEHTDLDDLGRLARLAVEAAAPHLVDTEECFHSSHYGEMSRDLREATERAERAEASAEDWRNATLSWRKRAERAEGEMGEYKKTLEAWEQGHVGQLEDDILEWQEKHAWAELEVESLCCLADELAAELEKYPDAPDDAVLAKWEAARR